MHGAPPIRERAPALLPRGRGSLLVLACLLSAGGAGCHHRVVHAAAMKIRPPKPAVRELPLPPDIQPEAPADIEALVNVSGPPPPAGHALHNGSSPRKSAADPTPPPTRPQPPQILPQMSPGEQASLERKANEAMDAAEKNLHRANGRTLNPSQEDLVDKIQSFLAQAHEAMQASDWTRAVNLAQKANILSVELANSL